MHPDNIGSQFQTYYHGTTKDRAESILKHGPNDNFYLHPESSIASDYGDHVLTVQVPHGLRIADSHGEHHDGDWADQREKEGHHGYHDKSMGADLILFHPREHVRVTSVNKRDPNYY